MKELTLIIPAKKEAESLPSVLNELQKYNYKIDVVLHPTDLETINAIKKYDINIVYQKNLGFGDALIYGIKQCKTKYFCIFNADGSFNPKELNSMYEKVSNENFDLVFGSRYELNSGSEDDTLLTWTGNKIFSLIGKILFNLPISDILYTYTMGKTSSFKKLSVKEKDFRLCVELPIKAKKFGLRFLDISSYERPRIAGKKKVNAFKDGFLILSCMLKLFLFK